MELGVKKKFADWIKERINQYKFTENEEWKLDFSKKGNQSAHGEDRKSKDYALTLDMAKELSMVENKTDNQYTIKILLNQTCDKELLEMLILLN